MRALELESTGATLVDSAFELAADTVLSMQGGRAHGFRRFTVPTVVITMTDCDTLGLRALQARLRQAPYDRPPPQLFMFGIQVDDTDETEEAQEHDYENFYYGLQENAETCANVTGRNGNFAYSCSDEASRAASVRCAQGARERGRQHLWLCIHSRTGQGCLVAAPAPHPWPTCQPVSHVDRCGGGLHILIVHIGTPRAGHRLGTALVADCVMCVHVCAMARRVARALVSAFRSEAPCSKLTSLAATATSIPSPSASTTPAASSTVTRSTQHPTKTPVDCAADDRVSGPVCTLAGTHARVFFQHFEPAWAKARFHVP